MNKVRKGFISILLFTFFLNTVQAQSPQDNLDKYWNYRYRLKHYFLVPGMKQGCSLPAAIRNGDNNGAVQNMYWGETVIPLAYYIATLATEYRLLRNSGYQIGGAELNQTVEELFYALHAVFRLDSMGYAYGPYLQQTGVTFPGHGFLPRDDVSWDFINNYCDYLNCALGDNPCTGTESGTPITGEGTVRPIGYPIPDGVKNDWGYPTPEVPNILGVNSDWINSYGSYYSGVNNYAFATASSHDMYTEMIMALKMVMTEVDNQSLSFVDGNGNNISQYNGSNINLYSMAKQLGKQITGYMAANGWVAKYPGGGGVGAGENSTFESQAFSDAAGGFWSPSNPPGASIANIWGSLEDDVYYPNFYQYNQSLPWLCALAAASNSPSGRTHFFLDLIPYTVRDDNAQESIRYFCTNQHLGLGYGGSYNGFESIGWGDFYQSILMLLFPGSSYTQGLENGYSYCNLQTMLNSAPSSGPFDHNGNDLAGGGWGSDRRFIDNWANQVGDNGPFPGNYNGLDYMLLFNFQNLIAQQYVNQTVNVSGQVPTLTTTDEGQDPNSGDELYYDQVNNNLVYTADCAPIIVSNFQDLNATLSMNTNPNPYDGTQTNPVPVNVMGNVTITGSNEYDIDFTSSGTSYVDIANGAYLDAICILDCSNNCSPIPFTFEPDPSTCSLNMGGREKRFSQKDSTAPAKLINGQNFNSLMNYPNPFKLQTAFQFNVNVDGMVSLYITDLLGQRIADIATGYYPKGSYSVILNNNQMSPGLYLCILQCQTGYKAIKIEKIE